jgi:hypothetical protein
LQTHPDTPRLSPVLLKISEHDWNGKRWNVGRNGNSSPTKKHFFTLLPTLEDGEFSVKEYRR